MLDDAETHKLLITPLLLCEETLSPVEVVVNIAPVGSTSLFR